MSKVEYPKMIFHKDFEPVIVNSKEEHADFGKDWEEAPVKKKADKHVHSRFDHMTRETLIEKLVEGGHKKSELAKKSKEDLATMLEKDEDGK